MNGSSIDTAANLPTVSTTWQTAAVNDFDGDGKSDILLRNTTTGDNTG